MGQAKNIVKRGSFGRSAAGAAPLSPTERRDGLRQGHGLGAGPLAGLQCAVPPRRRFGAAWALYYNARYRLGAASVPLGPSIYNARYRLGTASVPLGPLLQPRLRFTEF